MSGDEPLVLPRGWFPIVDLFVQASGKSNLTGMTLYQKTLLLEVWAQWRSELHLLSDVHIPRCYYPKGVSMQLHGFYDTSEEAYGGVVYLRLNDSDGNTHTEIVAAKTKVSPIKRLSIPLLELCSAQLLTKLLCHVKKILTGVVPKPWGSLPPEVMSIELLREESSRGTICRVFCAGHMFPTVRRE